ncbi:MAG: acyltransferase [Acidobacteriia bacterium]|nr:acyltransferase [Terriglobia bacterium]
MQKPEIKPLTGVRAFASWWVVLFHLRGIIADLLLTPRSGLVSVLAGGNFGVDLFFVLSGFVLAYNYHDAFPVLTGRLYGRFLWQRLARIYPIHCLGLAIWGMFLVANSFLKHKQAIAGNFSGKALVAQIFLVQAWSIPDVFSWNYPAWSISMEWMAYLGFPFLIRYIIRRRSSIAIPAIAVCVLGLGAPFLMNLPAEHFVRIISEFASGCLLYMLFARGFGQRFLSSWVAPISFLVAVGFGYRIGHFVMPVFIVLIYALLFDRGAAAAVFGSGWCMYGGRVSYSLYMVHAPVISACHYLLPINRFLDSPDAVKMAVFGAYVAAIAISGVLAYHYVELPCRRQMLRGNWLGQRTRRPAAREACS